LLDGGGYGEGHVDVAQRLFGDDANIDAFAGGYFGATELDGTNVPLLGVTPGASVHPPILEGRAIETAHEAVLGTETMAKLHKQIGDRIGVLANTGRVEHVRIVGTATLPTIGVVHGTYTSLGLGAMVDQHLVPGFTANNDTGGYTGPNVWFVKFRDGVDRQRAIARLRHEMGPVGSETGALVALPAQRPAEIVNATDIGSAPTLLAATLALAALTSLGLALATSVRRRRRDLALLKTLGFTSRQIAATVRWQAALTVVVGVVIGAPLGVITGRMLWRLFADQLNVVPDPSTPFVVIGAISVAALVIGMIAAAAPARVARRVQPSVVLHTE
jgi:hypothetical protein